MAELRLAELVTALSLATDLGMGQPMEHALRTCLLSLRLGEALGLGRPQLSDVYYVALLRFLGCTADAHETAVAVDGDDLAFRAAVAPVLSGSSLAFFGRAVTGVGRGRGALGRARAVGGFLVKAHRIPGGVAAHCEVAEHLARRLGLGPAVRRGLAHALERWDGGGLPAGVAGEGIALPARIVCLARDVEVLHRLGPPDAVGAIVRRRRGGAYDPAVVAACERCWPGIAEVLEDLGEPSVWERVLAAEPAPRARVGPAGLDGVLEVFADFVDLKSPFTLGHSRGVAALAAAAAPSAGLDGDAAAALRRAGLVHDLGRVGVPNGVWDKPGPLSAAEWERVRLHPYYTERILARAPALAPLAATAGRHHERLDGSGYHRGDAAALSGAARLLAVADAYQAMTQPRPHRPARLPGDAAAQLGAEVAAGRLDRDAAGAVLHAAGQPVALPRPAWPAGLSEREVDVLRLLCRGLSKREAAAALVVAPATVDHHVRHIYGKIGVATRAGAAVFALEHGLLPE
jgi:HD-GYP domain-containing protein (c-di-GMP phosphodiesterase class II)/DNA-binding CsgD family transcriptional regulator